MFVGSCQDSAVWKWTVMFLVQLLLTDAQDTEPRLVRLPEEGINELGCIPEGRNVSYECTVVDTSSLGSTIWSGSAFQCPVSSNQINLPHGQFSELEMRGLPSCGTLRTTLLNVNGSNYVSQLSLTATTELNGTTISCSFGNLAKEDVVTVGAIPPPPGLPMVTIISESSLTVSWSPPSGPVEGGVGGYEFNVTGEGCGCVSINVSSDTTSVTCSGWTAAGQTCSFEVRTISRDCGFISDPSSITFTVCDPAELGDRPSSLNSSGTAVTSNGVIEYTGVVVGSVANLTCNEGHTPGVNSSSRICMNDGKWSGINQTCESLHSQPIQDIGITVGIAVGAAAVAVGIIVIVVVICLLCFLKVLSCICLKRMGKRKKDLCVTYSKANAESGPGGVGDAESVPGSGGDAKSGPGDVGDAESVPGSGGDAKSGPGDVGDAESGPGGVGDAESGPGGVGDAKSGPGGVGDAESGPGGVGDAESGPGGVGDAESGPGGISNGGVGSDDVSDDDSIQMYDLTTNQWIRVGDLPERKRVTLVVPSPSVQMNSLYLEDECMLLQHH